VALVYNIPVGYWYQLSRDIEETHYLLKKARYYHSSRMGHSVETLWDLHDLGLQEKSPHTQELDAWSDLDLRLDYYGKRGPGLGLVFDYARPEVWGYFETYYIHDRGEDIGDVIPATRDRYRIKWLQRAFLPDNWQLDMEFSRISDPTFLREYYEEEFKEGKLQENIIYLKRQEDTRAFTFLYKFRLNDFFTQTEYLPQLAYYVIGEALWKDRLTFFSRSEAARVRLRPADGLGLPSEEAWRGVPNNLDFVYVDGNHSYPYVKRDLEIYYPKIREGGLLGGHDFGARSPGVPRAVLEFSERKSLTLEGKGPDFWMVKKAPT